VETAAAPRASPVVHRPLLIVVTSAETVTTSVAWSLSVALSSGGSVSAPGRRRIFVLAKPVALTSTE